jgi:hypothetical protein
MLLMTPKSHCYLFAALLLVCACLPAEAQNVRWSVEYPSISAQYSPLLEANISPNLPVLAWCNHPANNLPCTNYATTYTITGSACPNGAQDTPDPQPSACQSTGDAQGNLGVWAPPGTYDYTVCIANTASCFGPYTVTLAALGGGSFGTSGQGFLIGAGERSIVAATGLVEENEVSAGSNNQVYVYQFTLDVPWTLSNVNYQFTGGGTSGEKVNFGIYNAACSTKLIDASFNGDIYTLQTVTFPSTTLPAGTYWFALADSIGGGVHGPMSNPSGSSGEAQLLAGLNATTPIIATAANSLSGSSLPSSCGTLTSVTTSNYSGMPLVVWKP